jgi:hypothetical protein
MWRRRIGGRVYVLPPNGFAAKRPRVGRLTEMVDGQVVTTIRAGP